MLILRLKDFLISAGLRGQEIAKRGREALGAAPEQQPVQFGAGNVRSVQRHVTKK